LEFNKQINDYAERIIDW